MSEEHANASDMMTAAAHEKKNKHDDDDDDDDGDGDGDGGNGDGDDDGGDGDGDGDGDGGDLFVHNSDLAKSSSLHVGAPQQELEQERTRFSELATQQEQLEAGTSKHLQTTGAGKVIPWPDFPG
jgi:hypothetical protein